ncbi:MAG: integrase, partial [Gammaproteobacteria bacterium]
MKGLRNMTIPIDLPRPIESMALPMAMNGNTGSNRAQTDAKKQIEANDDMAAIQAWLAEFRDSPQTLRHYRKEAERLLLWALIERGKPLSSLSREDCLLYEDFLANPEPHERWCGPKVPRNHPGWRPFLGPLNPPSRRTALLVINSLFSYLVKAGYLSGNPLALLKRRGRKGSHKQQQIERFLEQDQWQFVLDTVEMMRRDTDRDRRHYYRARYLLALLYLLGPRVSEIAGSTMGSMIEVRGRWWWFVTGKGGKQAKVPVNTDMIRALQEYRLSYGLSPMPAPTET